MRAGHFSVRLTFSNGGYLKFTYRADSEFSILSFLTGDGLENRDGTRVLHEVDGNKYVLLRLGQREITYDTKEVINCDIFPAKSDKFRRDEDGYDEDDDGHFNSSGYQQDRPARGRPVGRYSNRQ